MNQLSIEIIDSDEKLHDLQNEWHLLEDECEDSSIFSSYTYVSTAWKYSKNKSNKLFIMLLKDGEKVVGIAPFFITDKRYLGIKARVIRYIAEFEGDKITLLAHDEKAVWIKIADFLTNEFHQWDVITLMEQIDCSAVFKNSFSKSKYFYEENIDSRSYSISLDESWDTYFKQRSKKVRSNWRRRRKNLNKKYEDVNVEFVYDNNAIDSAITRFIRLEQMGWKKDARIGVSKDENHIQFYRELLKKFSGNKNAFLVFLKVGDADIASNIYYSYKNKLYSRQTTYNPDYAEYSPGVYLKLEILKHYMEKEYAEVDLQGLEPGSPKKIHSREAATSDIDTYRQIVYKKYGRLFPFIFLKKLKQVLIKKSKPE